MSSKRAKRRKACDGKVRYAGHDDAQAQAVYRSKCARCLILPYRCQHCGGWHIGHAPAKVKHAMTRDGSFG